MGKLGFTKVTQNKLTNPEAEKQCLSMESGGFQESLGTRLQFQIILNIEST